MFLYAACHWHIFVWQDGSASHAHTSIFTELSAYFCCQVSEHKTNRKTIITNKSLDPYLMPPIYHHDIKDINANVSGRLHSIVPDHPNLYHAHHYLITPALSNVIWGCNQTYFPFMSLFAQRCCNHLKFLQHFGKWLVWVMGGDIIWVKWVLISSAVMPVSVRATACCRLTTNGLCMATVSDTTWPFIEKGYSTCYRITVHQ